ncbi:VWA domain-containing protein [Maribius pontilimi]|uniref:VWA domain-containing protein n=1 Tax=Palleronia pontilimi TaxID=1964209 RepID=A0A934I8F1_9RHOB|nr:VWA domain-containing protein [Palleronia pontilimi]MBJ3762369.1 VWA domain-containing protein [Palleronia pontilimi]
MKLAALLTWLALPGMAAGGCMDNAMIVMDGSASMARPGYRLGAPAKIDMARTALARVLPLVPATRPMGLLTYGAGQGLCSDGDVRVVPGPDTAAAILDQLDRILPQGETPLAKAVVAAARALDHARRPATIAVVTDGLDTCGGAVCTAARILSNEGLNTVIHVVYLRRPGDVLTADAHLWRTPPGCLAHYTGGQFLRVTDEVELTRALSATLTCALLSDLGPEPTPQG